MKNLISYLVWCFSIVVFLSGQGCSPEEDVQPINKPVRESAPEQSVETLLDFLSNRMRINKEMITFNPEKSVFVIGGDMLIHKKEAEKQYQKKKGVQTEQWKHPLLVDQRYSHNITLYIEGGVPEDWKDATREAMNQWNSVTGIRINFSEVGTAASASITVGSYHEESGTVAWAYLPDSEGKPGNHISINTHYNGLAQEVKLFTMVHEMGHNIGLWHTNQNYGIFVNGTPVTDPNSVMNSFVLPWAGFTAGDETAIRMMYAGGGWKQLQGRARDIGAGADGTVWAIGTNWLHRGGYNILKWNGSGWTEIPGAAARIDVDPRGNAWVANGTGEIYRYNGSGWERIAGRARDIGIGADGTVWHIGWNDDPNGDAGIYRWNGSGWTEIGGAAIRIDVDPRGHAWVVNAAGDIYRHNGSAWIRVDGQARDIGISSNYDGTVFAVGYDFPGVYQYHGSGWTFLSREGGSITGDAQGNAWTADLSRNIYRFD